MIYTLSCFFRDLMVGSDASMAETLRLKLAALPVKSLILLRDHALDFVRVIELAIANKMDLPYDGNLPTSLRRR